MTRRLNLFIVLLAVIASSAVRATTLQDLIDSDDFKSRVYLQPASDIIVGQEVTVVIELSTTGWFAAGTEIELPEINHAVVTQRSQFATNASRREGAKTWAVQSWEISVFPQVEGEFLIPSMTLGVNLSVPRKGIVRGNIQTGEIRTRASIPAPMRGLDNWLATPELTVQQQWDKPLVNLKPGDSLCQTITIKAEHLLAMMLPAYAVPAVNNLASYPRQPALQDISYRGQKSAERIEVIDHIIQATGEFAIPEQSFHWWNTDKQQAETITLPAVSFTVGGAASITGPTEETGHESQRQLILLLYVALALVVLLLINKRISRRQKQTAGTTLASTQVMKKIYRASRRGDAEELIRWLYVWLDNFAGEHDTTLLREYARESGDARLVENVERAISDAFYHDSQYLTYKVQLKHASRPGMISRLRRLAPHKIDLKLNP